MRYRIRVVPEVEAWLGRLLAAGTERNWLQAWYADMILRCRTCHERYLGGPG